MNGKNGNVSVEPSKVMDALLNTDKGNPGNWNSDSSVVHTIQFPNDPPGTLAQDKAYCTIVEDGIPKVIRFHDYDELYKRPGLYEQLFYQRLKCTSPTRLAEWLNDTLTEIGEQMQMLRVLDVGAGNGMMGEALQKIWRRQNHRD